MNQSVSPTGRVISSQPQPQLQRLPIPLTPAQRADVERLRAAFSAPVEQLWQDWATRSADSKSGSTLYDSWLNELFGSALLAAPHFSQMRRFHEMCTVDLEAHSALFGIDIRQRKTQVAHAISQMLSQAVDPDKPSYLH